LGNFNPIAPRKAAELVDLADLGDASAVLADFAVAGLIKAYARIIETVDAGGGRAEVRDSRISRDLWRRICDEGKVADIWATGSVRLPGSDLRGGAPSVSLIGIRFDDKSLQTVISQHGREAAPIAEATVAPAPGPARPDAPVTTAASIAGDVVVVSPPTAVAVKAKSVPEGLPDGALTATVAQAAAALGLGRTTIDKLMKNGTLVRIKVGGRTLIQADGIRALGETGAA
jgi:excisionase family DNA binding protein